MRILLFANGVATGGTMVRRALEGAGSAHILCADGGALNAQQFGLTPKTIIGDLDSLNAEQVEEFARAGVEILRFPVDKDETDLELALNWCVDKGASSIIIFGALGGRFDQTLANVYLLALQGLEGIQIELVDGEQNIQLLRPGTHKIEGSAGDTISLIPLGGLASGITTKDLKYPLREESLQFGPARGISNMMLCDSASLAFRSGLLLLVHTCGRA